MGSVYVYHISSILSVHPPLKIYFASILYLVFNCFFFFWEREPLIYPYF